MIPTTSWWPSAKMKKNKFGEITLDEDDLCNLIMQGQDVSAMFGITVDPVIDIEKLAQHIQHPESLLTWTFPETSDVSVPEFDLARQNTWFMPAEYQQLDIAAYVLGLCENQSQLQRVGQELMLYQEHDLFDLLRYMKYLVDVMDQNGVIWGVGRGSSVASYVLYLLGVHRIDSMYYDLDPREFLR
jgi:hypothetical protein